ncbi:MAG: sensor histidine kinase [Nevskia sp.]|nr:sensor histidine kinase [Nevskia sp.]
MKPALPLYARLLLWLLLNLLLIIVLFVALPGRNGVGWNVLLTEPVRDRLLTIGASLAQALSGKADAERGAALAAFDQQYGVIFALRQVPDNGPPPGAGGPPPGEQRPPPDRSQRFGAGPPPDRDPDRRPPPSTRDFDSGAPPDEKFAGSNSHAEGGRVASERQRREMRAQLINIHHLSTFGVYQVSIPAAVATVGGPQKPTDIVATAPDLRTLLKFLGITDWVVFAALVVLASALLWWPFVWSITRTLVRITEATRHIADGRLDTRVASRRRDELGQLAQSVNRMAERLQNYVEGQQQFLADVAHEVTSPIARMQMGLGLLEPGIDAAARTTFEGVQDDVQQMSELLSELLLYSRAGMQTEQAQLAVIDLQQIVAEMLQREDPSSRVRTTLVPGLAVLALPALLLRALGNLVRNALRYSGDVNAPVEIVARRAGGKVHVSVLDRGPGVPAAALARLGEPFFRVQQSRSRDSGGTGLGLAIVRRCVAACGGEVVFRNRVDGGFEAELVLDVAAD